MKEIQNMNEKQLVKKIILENENYRSGNQQISDPDYDKLKKKLAEINPDNYLLHKVEEERFDKPEIRHETPMLSTENAFSVEDLEKWFNRLEKKHGKLKYKITPKLDGLSGIYNNGKLATRGDGYVGFDVSDAFEKGLEIKYPLGLSANFRGEFVITQEYFDNHLSEVFTHPRNVVVGAIKCDELNEHQKKAFEFGVIRLVSYESLPKIIGTTEEIFKDIDKLSELLECPYPVDGYIIEVYDETGIKEKIGNTEHHNRWMVAFKPNQRTATTEVQEIIYQTGRGGNITPVLHVKPVFLSQAMIKKVTGHNYGNLKKKEIGVGSVIEIVRSGEVIPKIVKLISNPQETGYVKYCPECGEETILINDIIKCVNVDCPAQIKGKMEYFFKTLKIDYYGPKAVEVLSENGYDLKKICTEISSSYTKTLKDFENIGFGPGQSKNLADSFLYALNKNYEDWKILSSLSIPLLGKGSAKKLLKKYNLNELYDLSLVDIMSLKDFGMKKAESIYIGLDQNKKLLTFFNKLFKIKETKDKEEGGAVMSESNIKGINIVFTGKLEKKRADFFKLCEDLGANPQKSITKSTDYLIMGKDTGQSKIQKAQKWNIQMITEEDFIDMLKEDV